MGEKINSRLALHKNFEETIKDLKDLNIDLPKPSEQDFTFDNFTFPKKGNTVEPLEEINAVALDAKKGENLERSKSLYAYDESFRNFQALEGTAYLTSHSVVKHGKNDFEPSTYLTFYFYTRSEDYGERAQHITTTEDVGTKFKEDYVNDRSKLLLNEVEEDSLLLIDGPLIGGQISRHTIQLNKKLFSKGILPIFIVKNTSSNLIVNHIEEFSRDYNSDIHWAYQFLSQGERTPFFRYVDQHNEDNAKVFCYIKPFRNSSPLRVEIEARVFEEKEEDVKQFMNLIYYLIIVQSDTENPQPRSIAIAEKYARNTMKMINFEKLMNSIDIMPEVNQSRF